MEIEEIKNAIISSRLRITDHADEEAQNDGFEFDEIYFSVMHGEIIEEYLNDKPFPSCLVLGKSFSGKSIHSVWGFNEENNWAVLITVYAPDPNRWVDFRKRKNI